MALKVSINGSDRSVYVNSLKVNAVLGNPSTASFDLRESIGLSPGLVTMGEEVVVYDDVLTETIRQSVSQPYPPGLEYETGHTGYLIGSMAHQTRATGTVEGMFANLYNLPDLRLPPFNLTNDYFIMGGLIDSPGGGSWIDLGLLWKYSDGKYYYAAQFFTSFYTVVTIVSTTAVVLDTSVRMSVSWNDTGTSTAFEIFINGSSEATATGLTMARTGTGSDTIQLTGEGAAFGIGQYFADIRIWRDIRTGDELRNNRFSRLIDPDLTDPNLDIYWPLNESSGTTVTDSGPYGNNGTLTPQGGEYLLWTFAPDQWIDDPPDTCQNATVPYRHFGGRVNRVSYELQEPDVLIQHIGLIDYAEACNRKMVIENFMSAHTGKYYCQYLGLNLLSPEGIGYGCIPEGSPTFSVPDWTSANCKKALDDIYTATGWVWYIDPYKELRYHAQGFKTAPFNIADSDSPSNFLADSMTVALDRKDYYNVIIARIMVQVAGVNTTYIVEIDNIDELVARAEAEGTSGVYEHWEDITNATTLDQAIALAQGLLTNASTMGMTVSYQCRNRTGLRVGQTQTIANSVMGVSGTFLIEQIGIVQTYPDLIYTVTASSWKRYKNSSLVNTLQNSFQAVRNWTQAYSSYTKVPYVPTH